MKKNFSGAIGYLLVGAFLYLAVTKATSNPKLFFNLEGIGIVFGGIVVAAIASFPHTVLWGAIKSALRNLSPTSEVNADVAEQVVAVGSAYQKSLGELEKETGSANESPFLSQCVNLILEGLNAATVVEIADKRIDEKKTQIQSQMNVMLTLSKYSPALGLAATVLGLVDLLGQLQDADMAKLGLGMAIALSATFYGIILSNLVFAPLSEMIASTGEIEIKEMEMIRNGIQCAMERKHPLVIGEVVNSYLDESNRIDFIEKIQMKNVA